jgi:hypothetical protein
MKSGHVGGPGRGIPARGELLRSSLAGFAATTLVPAGPVTASAVTSEYRPFNRRITATFEVTTAINKIASTTTTDGKDPRTFWGAIDRGDHERHFLSIANNDDWVVHIVRSLEAGDLAVDTNVDLHRCEGK